MIENAWRARGAGAALIILLTVLAYLPALPGKFVWDDDSWTTKIPGLLRSFSGLRSIWCQPTALQQYYPLTGTTFWIDFHLWGFWALPYHIENVLLHASAALLFWRLLQRLQVPGAWLAGAIFALHPVMVESVAWITERKNVLSLVLYLGALLAYGRFTRFWNEGKDLAPVSRVPQRRDWMAYGLAFVLFLAALLAKTTAFSLPAVIPLIGWWKRGRIRWRADILPTLPFFAVAIGLCLGTAWLEKNHVGAKGPEWAISFPERCLIAGRALWFYTGKLLWPANLCFIYPRWQLNFSSWWQWLYPVSAVGTLLMLWLARERIGRGPVAAALFFVGTLFPVLGFMNAYFMCYSFVCDHWTYLSSLGLIALAAGLVTRMTGHFRAPVSLYGFAAVVLAIFTILTWRQSMIYRDIETLWRDTLTKNPGAWLAHNNLGVVLRNQGRTTEAIAHYEQALRFNPAYALAHNNLGVALKQMGKIEEAIGRFEQAVRIKPDYAEAHCNLGAALEQTGRIPEAIWHLEQALRLKPYFAEAHNNLGNALEQAGKVQEAIGHYEQALRIKPDYVEVQYNLGVASAQAGRIPEAIEHLEHGLRIKPDSAEAHCDLGSILWQAGRVQEAAEHWEQALRIKPDSAEAHDNLGACLSRLGKVQEAIAHWEQALRIKPDYAEARNDLAIALIQQGKVQEAIAHWEQALRIKPDYVEVHNNLAITLIQQGKVQEAIAHWEQALRIKPDYTEAQSNLARARALQ